MGNDLRRKLPNVITMARLVLAVAFFGTLNAYRYPDTNAIWANVAVVLFIVAAFTDALDGYLARKWQATTVFGRIMDPFCDKFLVLGAFIYLAGPRFVVPEWVERPHAFFTMATGIYPWMVILIFGRELLVTGIRGVLESMGHSGGAQWAGKVKMILQSVSIPIILVLVVNFETSRTPWAMWTCHLLVYATLFVTVWSGIPYAIGIVRVMKMITDDTPGRAASAAERTSEEETSDS